MSVLLDNADLVAWAFATTLALFLISGVLSLLLGTLLVTMRVGPVAILRRAAATYVTVVRNTPLVIVFIFFRYALPKVGVQFTFVDIVIGESPDEQLLHRRGLRAHLLHLDVRLRGHALGRQRRAAGQAEAARAIGLPFSGAMTQVVLPQAIRASVPPLASVQIALLKNTTVAGVFGVTEAAFRMQGFTNDYPTERLGIFLGFAIIFVVLVEIVLGSAPAAPNAARRVAR